MSDPTIFSWELLDDEGLKNSTSMFVAYDAATVTVQDLIGQWIYYGTLVDGLVDAQILGGQVLIPNTPDGVWKSAPNAGNNVNQVMNLNFNNDFNSYATSILLPAYKESILLDGVPDIGHNPLQAFITAVLTGAPALLPQVFPNSNSLHDLNALRDAFLTVRKVRNQKRKTIVTP